MAFLLPAPSTDELITGIVDSRSPEKGRLGCAVNLTQVYSLTFGPG